MKLLITSVLSIAIVLNACTNFETEPPINFDSSYINQQITLQAPNYFNTFDVTRPIVLKIEYSSDNDIIFPSNYNLRIYNQTKAGWTEIKEIPTIQMQTDNVIFSSKNGTANTETLTVNPDLIDYSQDYFLRIYVFGDMKTNNGIEKVAAYVDIKLHQ